MARDSHHHCTPFRRLVDLLRPEAADIGVVAIFALVVGVLSLATPITVEALVNTVAFGRYMQPLVILAVMLFTFLSFAAILRGLQAYIAEIIQRRIFVRVVADLAHRLPRLHRQAFEGHHGPEMLNRFFEVVTVQKSAALLVLDGLAIAITAVIGMIVLAFYHPFLLGFDIVLLSAVAFCVFALGRGAAETAIDESYKKHAVASWLEQLALYPVTFKRQGGLERAVHEADRLTIEYVQARKKHFRILMRQIVFTLGLQAVTGTALLGLGGFLVIQGQLTLGQLVASELIVAVVVGSFAKLGKHMESYYDLLAAVDKLGHLFDLPIERQDGVLVERNAEGAEIRFHNVRLDFDSHRSILNDLTLTISPGERVALYGPAGAGKSLLLEMLYALREPSCGYIEFDGVDLRAIQPAALREQVALVCDVEVFEATIAENITMHRDQISHAAVRQSLESVGLWKEIMQLPQGLGTRLIPGGGILTDSQLIRLMLARALAGRPRLLLIDSIMDQLPDDQLPTVLQTLTDGRRDKTIILVTGREMLLDGCDQTLQFGAPDGSEPDSIEKPLPSRNPEASLVRFLAP